MGEHSCGGRCPCKRFNKLDKAGLCPIISPAVIARCDQSVLEQHSDLSGESWITCRDRAGEPFAIGCWVCAELLAECDKDVFGRFGIETVEALKPYRLKAHSASEQHLGAIARLLQPLSCANPSTVSLKSSQPGAPESSAYEALLHWVRKGGSLRDGIPNVGHFKKCRMMAFTLSEGIRRVYRAQLLAADTIGLLRDERHGKLLVRFRCATAWPGKSVDFGIVFGMVSLV